ncbi:MAG TPA: hypothetical protein PLB89_04995 [Flavobacteriales bacterium]|nr:hypothetical protein [Flavobacteriales bacterium]
MSTAVITGKAPRKRSTFRGVFYEAFVRGWGRKYPSKKPWNARLYTHGHRERLGGFATEREAAIAFDRRVIELKLPIALNILKPVGTAA